ncbi:MAG: hypothetical protein ACOC1L_03935 [Bacillota bacterium]
MSEDKNKEQNEQERTEEEKKPSDQDIEKEQKKLEELLKTIKALEEKKKQEGKKPRKKNVIAIEFGSIFHHNPWLNLLGYFVLNMTVIYTVITVFQFGEFDTLLTVILFSFSYTLLEFAFRTYILMRHFKVVLKTFGFIFYFGYLTIFYILNTYVFVENVAIYDEVSIVVFVGLFILTRYIISKLIRQFVFRR